MNIHKFSIVMVPDYLVDTLAESNITLELLDKAFGNYEVIDIKGNKNEYINKLFKEKVSKNDIIVLSDANTLLTRNILPLIATEPINIKPDDGININSPYRPADASGVSRFIKNDLLFYNDISGTNYNISDFISLYTNNNIDINTIIMNGDNDSYKQLFEFKVTDNTVYVILHTGFTNFIPYGVYEFKSYFLKKLMNCVINAFGEETMFNSLFFKSYLRK